MSPESPRAALTGTPLTGKPLVFMFMAATVAAVVIFLCGVMVGRGVQSRVLDVDAPVDPTRVAPRTRPAGTRLSGELPPSAREVLTYPGRLETSAPVPETLREASAGAAAAGAPVPPSTSGIGTEPPGPGLALTVGVYQDRAAADIVAQRLAARGYTSYVAVERPGGQPRFFVRVGKYRVRRDAEAAMARLAEDEQLEPVIAP